MKRASEKITAVFEFTQTGRLKAIFLNASNEIDQIILRDGLTRLLQPEKMNFIRRLFGMTNVK